MSETTNGSNVNEIPPLFITIFAMLAIFRVKLEVIQTITCSAVLGVIYHLGQGRFSK